MDYTRQRDWFDPSKTQASVTMVGCGGVGSFAAFALAKLGVRRFNLIDPDIVEEHNIPNQMFTTDHRGMQKTQALHTSIDAVIDGALNLLYDCRLQDCDPFPLSDIVVAGLDSMEARADLWQLVKYKVACKLFLDARLAGQYVVLYAVNPLSMDDIAGYEATLHSDDEALELSCTARSIIDVGFAVSSLITRAVRRHYAGDAVEKMVYLDQSTLDIYKGGWS